MSIQKNANKGSNCSVAQLIEIFPKSITKLTNGSEIIKGVPTTQSGPNEVSNTSCTYKATDSKCNVANPKINTMHTMKTVSNVKVIKKVPVLKITINKKYNRPCMSTTNKSTLNNVSSTDVICKAEQNNSNKEVKTELENNNQNVNDMKPIILNLVSVVPEKNVLHKSISPESRHTYVTKTAYTRKGNLSRDNSRYQTSAEKIRYLYTKAQRDCDILRIRLKALRERHKQEKEEIRRLQANLHDFCKDDIEENINEIPKRYSESKFLFASSESTQEKEEEYERLLREVRKIKQSILNSKYSIAATNNRLKQINIQNYERSKIKRKHKAPVENNAEINKNQEIVGKIYNDDIITI